MKRFFISKIALAKFAKAVMMGAGLAMPMGLAALEPVSFVPEGVDAEALTPKNVSLVSEAKGDINKDGLEDLVLVFDQQGSDNECHATYWAVYFATITKNYQLFGAYECGSNCEYLDDKISTERQSFKAYITDKGLVSLKDNWLFNLGSQQDVTETWLYRYQNDDLFCIGSERNQYGTWGGSAGYGSGHSTNYLTGKRFTYDVVNFHYQVNGKWETSSEIKPEAPKSIAKRVWRDGTAALSGMSLEEQLKLVKPLVVVPPAHFNGFQKPASGKKMVKLQVQSSTENGITDTDEWVKNNRKGMPYRRIWYTELNNASEFADFAKTPLRYGEKYHGGLERHIGYNIVAYGDSSTSQYAYKQFGYDCNVLVEFDRDLNTIRRVVDFSKVADAFNKEINTNMISIPEFHSYVKEDNILYVVMSHRTYASQTNNKNAYLMAVDLRNGEILWMTQPLTCNSDFIIIDNSIVCGYGFSGEPHYVCVIDKLTGRRTQKLTVLKSPQLFSLIGEKLYMRTYSYDYMLKVTR